MFTTMLKAGASILCRRDRQKCLIVFQTQKLSLSKWKFGKNVTLFTIWHTTILDVMTHESWYIICVTQNIVPSSQYCVNVYCPCDEIRSDCSVLLPNMVSQASKKKIIYSFVSLYFCWDGYNTKKNERKKLTLPKNVFRMRLRRSFELTWPLIYWDQSIREYHYSGKSVFRNKTSQAIMLPYIK